MATTYQRTYSDSAMNLHNMAVSLSKTAPYFLALGRILFSIIFIVSGLAHFTPGMINFAADIGVTAPTLFVPLTGFLFILGGLSVGFGYKARWGAIALIVALIPVTLMMHNFWNVAGPVMRELQTIHFMKNMAILGGAIFIAYFGAGPISMDSYLSKKDVTR